MNLTLSIPGLLFIDTPGHVAFTSLRKRGGSLADLAILVIDINEGFMPQSIEALEILKSFKTPFIVAANKIDLIPGFIKKDSNAVICLDNQKDEVKQEADKRVYELVGTLSEKFNMISERYDRVDDFTKQVSIIPCSAKEQVGLEEILVIITAMAQKYLDQSLKLNVEGPARGIILEVKEDKGLGRTIDVILYDGSLTVGESIIVSTLTEPKECKVRALLMPEPLSDMRDKKAKFKGVKQVDAATGVKISSADFDENIVAGMPIFGIRNEDIDAIKKTARSQVEEVTFDIRKNGIIVKADTLGSLEALLKMLEQKQLSVRKASIGNITRKDITDAETNLENDPINAVIVGFNVKSEETSSTIGILTGEVIYSLLENLDEFRLKRKSELEAKQLDNLARPFKIEVLKNCIFRQNNPCIAGVEIIQGKLKAGSYFMDKTGRRIAEIKSLESEKQSINIAERGRQIAASMPGVTAGRQILEGEIYYSDISEDDFRRIKKLAKYLSKPEIELLKEIATIKRKTNPVWGI